jgi:SAM-dependent methyltransferase
MPIISHGHALDTGSPGSISDSLGRDIESTRAQLATFDLGAFLLKNLGLNGYWTSYILLHPDKGRQTRLNNGGRSLCELESWLLDRCPIFIATQERYRIFKKLTQAVLRPSMELASIPCGLMDDLLSLDYSALSGIRITGVDLDKSSLAHAQANFDLLKPRASACFEQKDAWTLDSSRRWDLITSNGLNIYVEDDTQCVELYKSFSASLKQGGYLVVSFITPPTTWQPKSSEDLAYQKFLFTQVIPVRWQCVRTEATTREQLLDSI